MFEAELFGIAASQFRDFASLIALPCIGFVFLFLLGRPLTKLPFLDAAPDYSPPKWVLPAFAVVSLFAISFSLSVGFFLTKLTTRPAIADFLKSYYKERPIIVKPTDGAIQTAEAIIEEYDGYSNFGVLVNNYLIFSSEANCMMIYQCRTPDPPNLPQNNRSDSLLSQINALSLYDRSIHNIHRLYSLPHSEDILGFLTEGMNHIDITSGNSGRGDCKLRVSIVLRFPKGSRTNTVYVTPDMGKSNVIETEDDATIETFKSGGESSALGNIIIPYMTRAANGSYRLCERVRFNIYLEGNSLPAKVKDIGKWSIWALDRWADTLCEISNGQEHCPKTQSR